ncbi:16772_t:CDS:2 [Acaulospora morrowiae]|uniref:16772_t:CDS:1 n=1 Tax=Acaulospora morrowiae TaxID=94023 RepID=A0A9N8Z136_9GLOM|nr:16772_t:CDS:2 [Acaulospora morrowiae]
MTKVSKNVSGVHRITSKTLLRKFRYTLYEGFDTLVKHVRDIFKPHTEICEDNPNRVGWYDGQGESEIKGIMQANLHIDFADQPHEECIEYCKKKYNWCKLPEHNLDLKHGKCCKCSYQDLSLCCRFCNDDCVRILARVNENVEESGPFEFNGWNSIYTC